MLADQKIFGRRMMIEEVEGSDDDHDDEEEEDNVDGRDDISQEDKITNDENLKNDLHSDGSPLGLDKPVVNDQHLEETGSGDAGRNGIVDTMPPEESSGENLSLSKLSNSALDPPGPPSSEKASSPSPPASSTSSAQMVAVIAMRNKAEELFRVGQYGEAAEICGEALMLVGGCL